jgi:hypothetical protein
VTSRSQTSFHDVAAIFDEGANNVADHRSPPEEFSQLLNIMFDADNFVVGGLNPRDLCDHILDARRIAARGDKRHMQFPQIFADQAAGVTRHTVNNDRSLVGHITSSRDSLFV